MQRIFLTHIAPKDKILEYNLSVAASNFCHNLINGRAFDTVYSILPTFVTGKIEPFDGLVYSSLRNLRFLNRLAPIVECFKLFSKIPRQSSIWYYNCTILNAPLIILLKLFKPKVKQQIIILDYTPSNNLMDRFLLWLTNHLDGAIKLADSPLFTIKNSICLPGVVPNEKNQYPRIISIKKEFLISGVLNENISMLSMLLDAFSEMPELTLHITGNAPNLDQINRYTQRYNNIIYHGMVGYEGYLHILHGTPFLLSTRNPTSPENQCNFPSKIIEALLHNRIVVSSLEYRQLDDIKYLIVAADKESFIKDMIEITTMPKEQLLLYANQSDITINKFSVAVWRDKIHEIEMA